MTQSEFEKKWHREWVKLNPERKLYKDIPDKLYIVTAALYNDEEVIFAIMAHDYSLENKHWFTCKIEPKDLDEHMACFTIMTDEQFTKDLASGFLDKQMDTMMPKAREQLELIRAQQQQAQGERL
jgi:hypothetical protein